MIERDVCKVLELDPQALAPGFMDRPTETVVVTLKDATEAGAMNTDFGLYVRRAGVGLAVPYSVGIRQVSFTAGSVVGAPGTEGELHYFLDIREDGNPLSLDEVDSVLFTWYAMSSESASPSSGGSSTRVLQEGSLGDFVAAFNIPVNESVGYTFQLRVVFKEDSYTMANHIQVLSELYL